mmetsp:Transcript_110743/g.345125  ORF Transcript_110743/g.345125 Transcript_110743/m.345125 type:complete len:135 (+) Transcript_110743:102-506(+)
MRSATFVAVGLAIWQVHVEGKDLGTFDVAKEMLKMMDKDGNGWLDRDEIEEMGALAAGKDAIGSQIGDGTDPGGDIFAEFDADQNGKVTNDEIDLMFSKAGAEARARKKYGAGSKEGKGKKGSGGREHEVELDL